MNMVERTQLFSTLSIHADSGAWIRVSYAGHASNYKNRIHTSNGQDRCSHINPTLRQRAKFEYPFHMLFLDGEFTQNKTDQTAFVRTKAPTLVKQNKFVHIISIVQHDAWSVEGYWFAINDDDAGSAGSLYFLSGCTGSTTNHKVSTLQTVPARIGNERLSDRVAKQAGFPLHASVCAATHQRTPMPLYHAPGGEPATYFVDTLRSTVLIAIRDFYDKK